jgi:outer membrane protein OmpA-like peptidoglycan-associated protein
MSMKLIYAAVLCGSVVAHADSSKLEVGAAIGGHAFSGNGELGVDDEMTQPGPVSNIAVGARAAYFVIPRLAVEGELITIPTHDDAGGSTALAFGMRAHVRFDVLHGRLRPFVVGGVGMHLLSTSSPQMQSDADQSYHWGGGVRWALSAALDLRVDARHLIVPDRTLDGATSDFELTAGVSYRFGAKATPARATVAAAPPPPAPAPAAVIAPVPALDRDLDTIADTDDKCPSEAEDIDNYGDSDGCPELDNDMDGVNDDDDTCPTDAETKNGFKDDDGCPDQVIGDLAGIGFSPGSAKLDATSEPLARAYEMLTEYPGLFVEIAGHTSAGEGNAERAMTLSLQRAEAVKAALVARGIDASRIMTVGHGADKPVADNKTDEGRRKNRRIEFRIMTPDEMQL